MNDTESYNHFTAKKCSKSKVPILFPFLRYLFKMNIPTYIPWLLQKYSVVDLCLQTFSEVVSHKRLADGLFIEVPLYFKFNSLH